VILIVQVHPHHHTIHFYFRCTGRRGPAIPITSTPTYAWDNFTLLCNQTHDPLKCRSETKFHTVCGYSMHIWFTEKKCRPGVCNRFWNETPVQSLSTSGTQTQQSAQMWEQSVRNNSWGVCVWVGGGCKKLAERGHTQLIGFLLSVTDGYLLGVHVVRKCYANLLGRGVGVGGQNLSRRLNAPDRVNPRTKIFRRVYFPCDESFGRITSVNRYVTVALWINQNQFLSWQMFRFRLIFPVRVFRLLHQWTHN
jgi:hypothetical protein